MVSVIMANVTIMASVTYVKCYLCQVLLMAKVIMEIVIMASVIMANVVMAKVLWQMKLSLIKRLRGNKIAG